MARHFDLNAILQRDWDTLGPKLQGKLHLYAGSDDTYFLNDAVYLMQDFLDKTGTPGYGVAYGGEVEYGPRRGALLERRPEAAECAQPPALQHHVPAGHHGADCGDSTGRGGYEQEVLRSCWSH